MGAQKCFQGKKSCSLLARNVCQWGVTRTLKQTGGRWEANVGKDPPGGEVCLTVFSLLMPVYPEEVQSMKPVQSRPALQEENITEHWSPCTKAT